MHWRVFDVEVAGYPPVPISAASRSKAMAAAYRQFSDAWPDITFRQFLSITKVRRRGRALENDGYDYVRRNYGVNPNIGGRVRLRHEGPSSGQEGQIVYPGPNTCYVHVVLDGRDDVTVVHPMNVELLPAEPPTDGTCDRR